MDPKLSLKVRKLFERGRDLRYIFHVLEDEGYSKRDIRDAIDDYIKDENTDYDDKLIRYIEKSFNGGKVLSEIYNDLIEKGNSQFEVEKAILRSFHEPAIKTKLFTWKKITKHMFILFLLTIIGSIFIDKILAYVTIALLVIYAGTSLKKNMSKNRTIWKTDVDLLPMTGIWATQGLFGYNPLVGNYMRWWVLDPITIAMFLFIILAAFEIIFAGNLLTGFTLLALFTYANYIKNMQ